ncbi:MAG: STAS domain-containing protein [Acidimicrobiales bacterium]
MEDPDTYFTVAVEAGDVPRVVATGELDAASSRHLEEVLRTTVGDGSGVALDLSGVSFIDSSGLRVITAMVRDAEAGGASFDVVGASDPVRRIFEITGLAELLPTGRRVWRPEPENRTQVDPQGAAPMKRTGTHRRCTRGRSPQGSRCGRRRRSAPTGLHARRGARGRGGVGPEQTATQRTLFERWPGAAPTPRARAASSQELAKLRDQRRKRTTWPRPPR